jgi:hypothetical protein
MTHDEQEPTTSGEAGRHGGARRTTRAGFVRYGAAGLATASLAGAGLSHLVRPARAQEIDTDGVLHLFINHGHVAMIDGSLVYMRGYGERPTDLNDPHPSLVIEPRVFLRDGRLFASRHYPLDAALPEDGCPDAAGIDPRGPGLHVVRRRHWASFFPRRTIVAESGSEVRLRVQNRLAQAHTFTIAGVVDRTIAPGATVEITFPAPAPGTYIYHDRTAAPVNRVLGLHGVLLVAPADDPWRATSGGAEFERQWLWILHDIDPEWGRKARMGVPIDPVATPALPRYFTINDRSGVAAIGHSLDERENERVEEDTTPCGHGRKVDVRDFSAAPGQLVRLVNTGIAVHQPHFHGNHVWTLSRNGVAFSRSRPRIVEGHVELQTWEDVVELDPLDRKDVVLPVKPPPDALDEVVASQKCKWVFPMHCHAEMSQTAAGGLYPGGMVSDWKLAP